MFGAKNLAIKLNEKLCFYADNAEKEATKASQEGFHDRYLVFRAVGATLKIVGGAILEVADD